MIDSQANQPPSSETQETNSDNQTSGQTSNIQPKEFTEQPAATRDDKGDEGEGTGGRAGEYS